LKDDPKFEEFVQVHSRSGNKSLWSNDEVLSKEGAGKVSKKVKDEEDEESEEDDTDEDMNEEDEEEEIKGTKKQILYVHI
jgi:hypothetical protein